MEEKTNKKMGFMSVHNRRVIILAAICLLLTFLIICVDVFLIHKAPQVNGDLTVTFLDVGQGDCILVSCDGQHMLIDGGAPEASQIVYSFLRQKNINHLSYLLSTHPHNDHTGGLPAALQLCSVDHIFSPILSISYPSRAFSSFLSSLEKIEKKIEKPSAGDEFMLGKAKCKILAPLSSPDHLERAEDANDISLVVRVSFGDTSFLFMGDAEKKEEEEILKRYGEEELRSTVLKAGHHGSDSSSSQDFVQAVSSEYSVICVGKGNEYGLPDYRAMKNLTENGAKLYRTDLHGTVVMTSNGKDIVVKTEKEPKESVLSEPTKEWRERTGEKEEEGKGEEGEEGKVEELHSYVVNKRTRKFHYIWCSAVENISEQNRSEYTGTRDELLEQGYSACGKCQP